MKLLTWNIQAAIGTGRYRDYLFAAHKQLIHTRAKTATLEAIAQVVSRYDVVCLQEVDLGGRRAGFRSQVADIAAASGHAFTAAQENRTIRGVSRHGNAVLSRVPLQAVHDIKLPGRFAGRGCLIVDLEGETRLRLACLHLSLGAADQAIQLAVVAAALDGAEAWAAAGDFNCAAGSAPLQAFLKSTEGEIPPDRPTTYPAWRPRHDYDHIIVGGGASLSAYRSEQVALSDHLPLSATIASRAAA